MNLNPFLIFLLRKEAYDIYFIQFFLPPLMVWNSGGFGEADSILHFQFRHE
jgi:hypothetical protein